MLHKRWDICTILHGIKVLGSPKSHIFKGVWRLFEFRSQDAPCLTSCDADWGLGVFWLANVNCCRSNCSCRGHRARGGGGDVWSALSVRKSIKHCSNVAIRRLRIALQPRRFVFQWSAVLVRPELYTLLFGCTFTFRPPKWQMKLFSFTWYGP